MAWGWYPAGGGVMRATITPAERLEATALEKSGSTIVHGVAAVTNLPAHIPQRMARRAHNLLADAGLQPRIQALRENGRAPGAGMVLWLPGAGFTSLGKRGLSAERVAEAAVAETIEFVRSGAAVDQYLADQLLLPLALAHGRSRFSTHRLTRHVLTNRELLHKWLDAEIDITGALEEPASLVISGIGFARAQYQG
jgi:RNA 3'-terminal phosphate cyclase (ATP)